MICICHYPLEGNTLPKEENTNNDPKLIESLLNYCNNNNLEIFKRVNNFAATDKGFFCCCFEDELTTEDPNNPTLQQ